MFSLILTNDGELYMWGKFILKEEIYFQYAKPTEISKKNKFINITLGNKHILAVNGQKEV